jgi:hypothetical protein
MASRERWTRREGVATICLFPALLMLDSGEAPHPEGEHHYGESDDEVDCDENAEHTSDSSLDLVAL